MGEGSRRRDHLGAGHGDAGVGFLLDGDEDVLYFVRRLHAVDRRIDDGVVHEEHVVLRARVPAFRILSELLVHREIGAERVHQRRLVVRRAPHPAVGHARPVRDRLALAKQILARLGDAEELVGEGSRARIGRACQHRLLLVVVQRVVKPRDRAHRVAERRMRRHIVDLLAVDVDLAAVAQAVDILRPGERPRRTDYVFWFLPLHSWLSSCHFNRSTLPLSAMPEKGSTPRSRGLVSPEDWKVCAVSKQSEGARGAWAPVDPRAQLSRESRAIRIGSAASPPFPQRPARGV